MPCKQIGFKASTCTIFENTHLPTHPTCPGDVQVFQKTAPTPCEIENYNKKKVSGSKRFCPSSVTFSTLGITVSLVFVIIVSNKEKKNKPLNVLLLSWFRHYGPDGESIDVTTWLRMPHSL